MVMLGRTPTDRELLDHYVDGQDAAFQALVSRHGATIHRICRGVLGDIHDAEDAFQATFLVLARKAPVIREPDALAAWLRGVAYRVAIRSRRQANRRRQIEKTRAQLSPGEPRDASEDPAFEIRDLVGDELTRLPEDYRRPIMLCYIDGLTHQEAARRLEWPVGTVKVRLVRGRRMLRERLNRRGVALGAGLLALLPPGIRAETVTMPLIDSTARAMALSSAGRRAALVREFPGATDLADAVIGPALAAWARWVLAAMVFSAASTVLAGTVGRALAGPPVSDIDPNTLPDNLIDVLKVECR